MYRFIILIHLISSFLHNRFLFVPCAYVSIESVDCILLSSFELKTILLTFSVNTLSFSILNLCCSFKIDLLFFMSSSWSSLRLYSFQNSLFYFEFELILSSFYNLEIYVFFWWHTFLCLLLFIFIIVVF